MHGLNLKIVIWYSFFMCVYFALVISFLDVFETIIFDLKYILDLIYCTKGVTDNCNQVCLMFLPMLLASNRTLPYVSIPIIMSLLSIFSARNLRYLLT